MSSSTNPSILPRLDTTRFSSTSHSPSPVDQSEPLLPPPLRSTLPPPERKSTWWFQSATRKKRTSLYLFLVFLGILVVTIRVWNQDDARESADISLAEQGGGGGSKDWRSRLTEWREWALMNSAGREEGLGWGWTGSNDEGIVGEQDDKLGDVQEAVLLEEEKQDREQTGTLDFTVEQVQEIKDGIDGTSGGRAEVEAASEEKEEDLELNVEEKINVRPFVRRPSRDPNVKYLSFENHSGFHNQRKSLVNALVLSRLLNRTLLLPPARLGSAIPWGPDLDLSNKTIFSEECKAGFHPDLPTAPSPNSHLIPLRQACDDSKKWTYVGWSWLISPELFKGREIVDRWNASREWFVTNVEDGGLGLGPDDIHGFADGDRRSYQLYDSRETPTEPGFKTRIDLEDLSEGPLADKRLLQFGSLFSGARLNLAKEENRKGYEATFNGVILGNEGLETISNQVRDRLGSYVAIHARTGSQERASFFWKNVDSNMVSIFRKLTHSVLGIKAREVDRMVRESTSVRGRRPVRRNSPSTSFPLNSIEVEEDDLEEVASRTQLSPRTLDSNRLVSRAHSGQPSKPLAPSLHCRKPLWPAEDAILSRLNTPLYIATDARSPTTEPHLRIFFEWFPCVFILSDFVSPTPGVSDESVPELAGLARGGEKEWVSDFDGSEMAKFVYPFLEAEIAARGVETVGTPGSTFSGYTAGMLHSYYESIGSLAPWNSD